MATADGNRKKGRRGGGKESGGGGGGGRGGGIAEVEGKGGRGLERVDPAFKPSGHTRVDQTVATVPTAVRCSRDCGKKIQMQEHCLSTLPLKSTVTLA